MDKSLRNWVSGVLLVAPVFLTSCSLNLSLPQLNESDKAEFVMQAMTTGQQAYYEANGQFANSIQGLSLNANLDTGEYRYSINTEGQYAQTVVMTAAAKQEGLPSYAGVVTVNKTEGGVMALANICKTDQPSTEPPALSSTPTPGEGLKCPAGSSPVQ
ncbi:type IV pilin-like G/H family protein [Planktothrix sp. FACHB-1365]|uniref:type IV pilin-like G/H family protein n=1 Tax=Planktothrix sp. FACHB-1365 TaxID=2692855 RepID=UPI0016824BBD|nr:type IV pilin-like G/H family protein [Planktothrix sp. FACHB-1365]MBD2482886.1 type IV pilin-like G/H family protein [Planktothrix sp. FACHB-1365]